MRLDKLLAGCGKCTRKEAGRAVAKGLVTVNGKTVKDKAFDVNEAADEVTFCGEKLFYSRFTYIMLNKPSGVLSATEDKEKTVIDLLPKELQRLGLFPCGRLDKNTEGLLLLTNNGPLSHFLLSPKCHVVKKYFFTLASPLIESDVQRLESGVDIGEYVTAPARVTMVSEKEGYIEIGEGKYHQIKLMMNAVGNKVEYLKRVEFGALSLDKSLEIGCFRPLSEEEIAALLDCMPN